MLYPVPPNISLPITTPKIVEIATIHKGNDGGITNGMRKPVTKKPSLTSCFLIIANITSVKPPTVKVTIYIGITDCNPINILSRIVASVVVSTK